MPYLAAGTQTMLKHPCCRGSGRTRRTTFSEQRATLKARGKLVVARALCDAERRAALSAQARVRASRTFRIERQRSKRRRLDHARVAVPTSTARKCFDAAELGQGHGSGGNAAHRNARHELFLRICRTFPPLPDTLSVSLERIWRLWGASQSRALGAAWDHKYQDDTLRLR